jgi:hypothetical protein
MKKLKLVFFAISSLLIVSCESTTIQDISGVVTNPTYNEHVKPV